MIVKLDVQVPKPFVYGTTHKLKGYDYLLNCPAFIEGHVLTYEYEPESFKYYSDDIVNLVPSADGNKYLLPNDDMIEAGVTTLDNATNLIISGFMFPLRRTLSQSGLSQTTRANTAT